MKLKEEKFNLDAKKYGSEIYQPVKYSPNGHDESLQLGNICKQTGHNIGKCSVENIAVLERRGIGWSNSSFPTLCSMRATERVREREGQI